MSVWQLMTESTFSNKQGIDCWVYLLAMTSNIGLSHAPLPCCVFQSFKICAGEETVESPKFQPFEIFAMIFLYQH